MSETYVLWIYPQKETGKRVISQVNRFYHMYSYHMYLNVDVIRTEATLK